MSAVAIPKSPPKSILTGMRVVRFGLYARIQKALNEKDVENVYRELFHIAFPDVEITSPHGSDGLLKSAAHDLVALMEFKYDLDFKKRWVVCEILVQCIYYLKKFEKAGDTIPKVLFVGDVNECFCVAVRPLEKYLASKEIDWSLAPSSSASLNPKLVKAIHEDETVVPYVWDLAGFNFNRVVDKMLDLNQGIVRHVVITESNVSRIFDDFCARVVTDSRYKDKGKDAEKKSNELVGIFLGILTQPDQFYLHPVKNLKNTLVTPTVGSLKVDNKAFVTFFGHFQSEYGPAERQRLVSICDRLIEDTKRRWDGAFFTPTHWVDEAHRMIERQLGANWKEEYVVWDCCYDDQTRLLTSQGWAYFKDLTGNELVYSLNPQSMMGEFVRISKVIRQPYQGEMHHYTGKRLDLAVTPDHDMFVLPRKRNDRNPKTPYFVKSEGLRHFVLSGNVVLLPGGVPISRTIGVSYTDDELRFIGLYLGDGWLFRDSDKQPNAFAFHFLKARKIKYLRECCKKIGAGLVEYPQSDGTMRFRVKHDKMLTLLCGCSGALTKRIPEMLFDCNAKQCEVLLEGLWESDGNERHYFSANQLLAEDVQRIAVMIGFATRMKVRTRWLVPPEGKPGLYTSWELYCSSLSRSVKMLTKKNVSSFPYTGMVYCVSLEKNHVFLVERNRHTVFCGNCWGTGNLTRDYKFKELYCSTLISDELQLGQHYNPEAVKFVYDFLSEVGLDKLPKEAEGLKRAFAEGRKVVFLVNPPYGTANNAGTKEGDHKAGIAKSIVHSRMEDCGAASQQVYAQFLYKMAKLGVAVATFAPPLFLTGGSYKAFRKFWFGQYRMSEGMLFQASEFADVAGQWGIMFSVWQRGQDDRTEWTVVLKRSSEDLENPVETFGEKVLYNLDGKAPASKWVRQEIKGVKTHDAPQIASALVVKQKGCGQSVVGQLGYMVTAADNVYKNSTDVFLVSECSSMAHGLSVIPANFRKCCSLFTARRSIGRTWENWQDEYSAPNELHPDYVQWNDDAIIYSLFNTKSNQSSLRNITYKGKTYQIHNEWFWMPREWMVELANKHHNEAVYEDARTDTDRYVAQLMPNLVLSPDARAVFDKASELVNKTFEFREIANDEHPEWHIQTWDAGYYQVKLLLKQYLPAELKAFQVLYKQLEDRLREGVYELGFLRK